ncbi:MAG TPA: extracellular solute-binding protein [Fimbriiglobus sp.]|nr:extracellular solute-binding protein [Fimbriiglobus sp.]
MTRPSLLLALATLAFASCQRPESRVVVYCAQDPDFAEGVFADFHKESGLAVAPKFDTEANKSVSLVAELQQEAGRPRADVHWNNEILGTIRAARAGLYEPYESPVAAGHPAWSKAKDRTWQAFAERARVLIVNTNLVPEAERPKSVLELTDPKWKGKVAMSKPQFGTSATQAACLFEVLGPDAAKAYYRGLEANDVQIVPGNRQSARGVADGQFAVGMTDTDDAVIELDAGKPVAIIFPDAAGHPAHPRMGTLYLPNTLAVVKGGPNPAGARKLIDFLLKPETEAKLAQGGGYQFPVHPQVKLAPHPALKTRHEVKRMEVDFEKAADLWDETQTFLREVFAR